MKFPISSLSLCSGLLLASFSLLEARTWTDVKGRKIEAEIVSKTEDSIKALRKGKEIEIPLSELSQADQDFVAEWEPEVASPEKKSGKVNDAEIEEYFNMPWPRLVSVDVSMDVEEAAGMSSSYVYRSPNYEFISDVKLKKSVVKRFAVLFEATRIYVQQIPYASLKAHKEGARHKIMLFETDESYRRAGGLEGSAGVYILSKDVIMVPFESLGLVKRSSSWAVDYDKTNKTLPHEITHQLMDREYFALGALGWFSEGIAEYVAVTPYRSGKFTVNKVQSAIKQYVTHSAKDGRGRDLGTEINAPDLEEFMMISYREFIADSNFNYGLGALLVTYFNHYDGKGDAKNMKDFLRALKEGKKGLEAIEALRAGRTFDELEADITKGWRKRGVKINFS